ncbi:hypothetical protein OF83DRAFT_1121423 [Amylostereum chailletii]|nr:hypothetical protein OF83DRAFT_1121423 [Amylostereum chailletii]
MVRVAWKTGRCENIHSAPFKSFSDLLFLSETTLVVINLCAHTLDLFQLIEGKDDTHLRLKASFELPQLEKGVRVLAVESRGNRLVGSDPSALPSSPGPRWRFDPDESLVVFHFAFHHLSWSNFATLVVHPRAFLRSHITSLHPVDAVPWEHWGPVHARWFTHGTTYPKCLSGASAGQRLAMFTEKKMRVYDFNRLRARRKGCIDSGPDEGFDGWFIGGTPTSKLEMSVVEKEMENDYKGVMLDGERVLGIKVRGFFVCQTILTTAATGSAGRGEHQVYRYLPCRMRCTYPTVTSRVHPRASLATFLAASPPQGHGLAVQVICVRWFQEYISEPIYGCRSGQTW